MHRVFGIASCALLTACVTFATEGSKTVTEYKTVQEMESFARCEAIDSVRENYDVFMHSPWERKRAAHIRIKDAASKKGANAVVMTANNWGTITDEVEGVAYRCKYRQNS